MEQRITVIRAISSEFVRRKLRTIVLFGSATLLVLLAISIYITTRSGWWIIFTIIIGISIIISAIGFVVLGFALRLLRPAMSASKRNNVQAFVDKLERVTETIGTPMFIIMFRVCRDLIWPHDRSFVRSVAADSTSLHSDFLRLERQFKRDD